MFIGEVVAEPILESRPRLTLPATPPQPSTVLLEPQPLRADPLLVPVQSSPRSDPPATILLPPVRAVSDAELRDIRDRRDRHHALIDTLEKHNVVSMSAYLRAERGRRLGSSGLNPCLAPEGNELSSNFSYDRLKTTGVCIFLPGIPVEGASGVRGYAESTLAISGVPVIVMVNNQHGLFPGDHPPGPLVNIAAGVSNSIAALRNSQWARIREPSIDKTADLIFDLLRADIPVRIVAHSQGTTNVPPIFAALAERYADAAWRTVPSDVNERTARSLMYRTYAQSWEKVRDLVSVDAYGPAQLRFHKGVQVNIRAFEDDPIYALGRFASIVKQNPLNPLVRDPDIAFPTRGGLTEFPGSDHDFDSHTALLHRFLIAEVAQGEYNRETGAALAKRFYQIASTAAYSDKVLHKMLGTLTGLWQHEECRSFILAFRSQLNFEFQADERANRSGVPLPPGSIGNFQISRADRKFFGLAEYNPNEPLPESAFVGVSRIGYRR